MIENDDWESGTSRGIFGGVYDSNGDFDFRRRLLIQILVIKLI